MRFDDLDRSCEDFRHKINSAMGRTVVERVSLDSPRDQSDALYFTRLVAWAYVFLFEVANGPIGFLENVLRAGDPACHSTVAKSKRLVRTLRTVQFHHLSPHSKSDMQTKTFAETWYAQHDGSEPWQHRVEALCADVAQAISCLGRKWDELLCAQDAAPGAVVQLQEHLENFWPAHTFDPIVESVARDIGLTDFDYVRFRNDRIEHWRKITGLFSNRQSAFAALSSAVRQEMQSLFGGSVQNETGTITQQFHRGP